VQAEYISEVKASDTRHRGEPARVVVVLDRAEAINVIAKLAAGLEVFGVYRDHVRWKAPPVITLPIMVDGVFFAEALISIDLTKGYLNGDDLKEKDRS
jgi:hypothetical protein